MLGKVLAYFFLYSARQPILAVRQNAYESSPFSYGSLAVPHG